MLLLKVNYEVTTYNLIYFCELVLLLSKLFFLFIIFYFISAGVPNDNRNWPPFFPIIHHDIANEIPVHAQRLQYLAFASWLGMRDHIYKTFYIIVVV